MYVADALGGVFGSSGGQQVDPKSQDAEPKANNGPPDPPLESFRIVFEIIRTCPGVE